MKLKFLQVGLTIGLLFCAGKSFSQAPVLGTAAGFVLFSSTGAVGNTGALSHFTGNIGTLSGAVTINVNVNGVIHNGDGAAIACTAAVLSAYQQLNATPPTSYHTGPLGGGDTIRAGVDSLNGNTLLDSTLILDGQGDANAVFIFKVYGTLTSSDSARVILINSAQACNVFWMVNSSISLNPGTVMRGTMISNANPIVLGDGTMLEGRALTAVSGAITTTNVVTYTPTGCGSPVLTGPVAPVLNSAACFAVFTSAGPNTNTNNTRVTGDVGSNSALTSGYDSLKVTGTIHTNPDGATASCDSDLLVAYNYMNVLPSDIQLLYPQQFGNSLVLTPHTYLLNAATLLTDTLFLNAEGNANAVFVLKINGAFTTSAGSTVVMTNGAQAKNIYWKVEGETVMGNFTVFKGTLVGHTGAIRLHTGTNVEGRAMTTSGAVLADSIIAAIPAGTCNVVALPVTWLYFRGKPVAAAVLLEWATTGEMSGGSFSLEKSSDATSFHVLATTVSEDGNTVHQYSFTDTAYCHSCYYRISQTDPNGQTHYYRTIQVNTSEQLKVIRYVKDNFVYVEVFGATPGNGMIGMYSMDGRRIASRSIVFTKDHSIYKLEKPAYQGIYLLQLESSGKRIFEGKVVVD